MKVIYSIVLMLLSALLGPAFCAQAGPDVFGEKLSVNSIRLRGRFQNARNRFVQDEKGIVAFLGGSITEREGYRPLVMKSLRRRFPETEFEFRNAGISSTCSTTGAFRLSRDVLQDRPPDLLFVEFAVNDDQDAHHTHRECIRGMEGIVRHARKANPAMDIVILYFVNPDMLATWHSGQVPLSVAGHRQVARRYQIPAVNVGKELAHLIDAEELTWEEYGGTHPGPSGNRLCASMVECLFRKAWREPVDNGDRVRPHKIVDVLDEYSYFRGQMLPPGAALNLQNMEVNIPKWDELPGRCRQRFRDRHLLCADEPGAAAQLTFEGSAVGAYVLAGPDAGTVEAVVDGKKRMVVDLYHEFSKNLHYPRTVMFFQELVPGKHTLSLRLLEQHENRSKGPALRLMNFTVN